MVYSLGFVDAVVGVVFDFADNYVLANTDVIGGGVSCVGGVGESVGGL